MDIIKLILVLLFFTFHVAKSDETDVLLVNPTLVKSDAGAVCLNGKPASYYYFAGFGNGTYNWLVYLSGGAWCGSSQYCIQYINDRKINLDPKPYPFKYILSNNKDKNPDFFSWNKVVINYCDGGSFTGDSEKVYNGTKLYFRGARIYNTVMQELLQKGMGMAQNALLVGSSAGGIAATLHCDRFRDHLPNTERVKCLSDAGYFFPSERFKDQGNNFVPIFKGLITLHGSTKSLPKSCTSRLSPHLCFFPQNVQHDIKTPIFFLMSAFDSVQVTWSFPQKDHIIKTCFKHQNCSREIIKSMQDLRLELLSVLPKQCNISSSRGILITSPEVHEQVRYINWDMDNVVDNASNETISKLFGDWYFDKKAVRIIDSYPCPYNCSRVPSN